MKNSIIIIFFIFFLMPLIQAEVQTLGVYKQNSCVNLIQTCDNCTFVNITSLLYPNSSMVISNKVMTKEGTYYNYTFCNTNSIGNYIYNTLGNPNGIDVVQPINFEITTTGEKVSLSNIILVLVFLGLSGFLFFIGYSFDTTKWIMRSSFFLFALFSGLLAINSGRIIASESSNLSTMGTMGLLLITAAISFMFLYMFIFWTIDTFKQVKEKRGVRWKY